MQLKKNILTEHNDMQNAKKMVSYFGTEGVFEIEKGDGSTWGSKVFGILIIFIIIQANAPRRGEVTARGLGILALSFLVAESVAQLLSLLLHF